MAGHVLTDDAAVAEAAGIAPLIVAGSEENLKVTTAEDLAAGGTALGRGARRLCGSVRVSMCIPSAPATM